MWFVCCVRLFFVLLLLLLLLREEVVCKRGQILASIAAKNKGRRVSAMVDHELQKVGW